MKILFVCKFKEGFKDNMIPFNKEFVNTLKKQGHEVETFLLPGGWLAYIKSISMINKIIRQGNFDIVHASYGLSGFPISFQKITPSVVTLVGSDIHNRKVRFLSKRIMNRTDASIFVSNSLYEMAGKYPNASVIPFGVDLNRFFPSDKIMCRKLLDMDPDAKYVLFAGRFDRKVKNAGLAKTAISKTGWNDIFLIELKNIPDEKMNSLFNACDVCLLTSLDEGSSQFLKEAMACNKPIVSTDVGDSKWVLGNIPGHYISSYDPDNVADNIRKAFAFLKTNTQTPGRNKLTDLELDIDSSVKRVINVYQSLQYSKPVVSGKKTKTE